MFHSVLNVVRHSDLNCGYNQGSKVAVLENEMNPKQSEQDIIDNLKNDIKIMISATEDSVAHVALQEYYKDWKHEGKEFLFQMLEDLSNSAFVFS